jgi:MoaA/NifB/PqqE/SkfB family radical SAM enzyme
MCRVAWEGRLNTHVSTNFSFVLSDERIHSLVTSGMTHLTVCVDGLHQETYGRTRVGGRLELVMGNLERLLSLRRELGRVYPKVEVQYIKYQHNIDDLEASRARCRELGVDQFTDFWGSLHNYTDRLPNKYVIHRPKPGRAIPLCFWPHFSMQIKYNGDVIPCCSYRQGFQYTDSDQQRVIGNVFETSVWNVWNSPEYRAIRRFVSDPTRVLAREPGLSKTFCEGCGYIYETDASGNDRPADRYEWEDIYTINDRGYVVRRPESEVTTLQEASSRLVILE